MSNGVVQISCLGNFGRFGNQLFQYAAARGYAESIGATLQTPSWLGQELFGLNDPPLQATSITRLQLNEIPVDQTNVDLYGYFQHKECFEYYTLAKLRQWFKFTPKWHEQFAHTKNDLAMHVRMGDYLSSHSATFCTVDRACYVNEMFKRGYDPVAALCISEESGNDWLLDFFYLMNARVLFRANSTFSWWAAALGDHAHVYSPIVEGKTGLHKNDIEFVEGNWPRCVSLEQVHDYHIKP